MVTYSVLLTLPHLILSSIVAPTCTEKDRAISIFKELRQLTETLKWDFLTMEFDIAKLSHLVCTSLEFNFHTDLYLHNTWVNLAFSYDKEQRSNSKSHFALAQIKYPPAFRAGHTPCLVLVPQYALDVLTIPEQKIYFNLFWEEYFILTFLVRVAANKNNTFFLHSIEIEFSINFQVNVLWWNL